LLSQLLLALALVIALGQVIAWLFRRVGQPPVIGEVVAGILLGPSFLGWLWPDAYTFVLPASVAPLLGAVAQLGVIFYMFLVGLELNPARLRRQFGTTVAISNTGIIVPFALGVVLAFYLYPRVSSSAVPFLTFTLFIGVAMSITAFPVLARILSDLRMTQTDLGALALACAAIDDVTAWCLLAFVAGVANASSGGVLATTLLTVGYIFLMFVVVRPIVARWLHAGGPSEPTPLAMTVVLVAVLLSALATEAIGVHAIFGAFLLGAVIPHDGRLAAVLHERFAPLVTLLLLPAFFAFTGMRTEIGLLATAADWALCAAIIAVAVTGKFGAVTIAGRLTGLAWRNAAGLGALMNTRGLMELIVLNVGLELGVISPRVFTMFVIMAIVTTMATTPMLRLLIGTTGTTGSSGTTGPR
jgi:Kef-type K+ transport system membrane component KefB